MERMMERGTRKEKKSKSKVQKAKPQKKKTYEEVLEEIRELEYRRIILPKRPSVRRSFIEDALTAQIRTKYKELEKIREEEGRKATTKTIIENLEEVFKQEKTKNVKRKKETK